MKTIFWNSYQQFWCHSKGFEFYCFWCHSPPPREWLMGNSHLHPELSTAIFLSQIRPNNLNQYCSMCNILVASHANFKSLINSHYFTTLITYLLQFSLIISRFTDLICVRHLLRESWISVWEEVRLVRGEKIYRNAGLLNYLQTKHPRNRQGLGIEKEIRFRGKRRHVLQKFPSSKNLQTSPEFNNQPAFVENIIGFICGGKRSINN